MKNYTPFGAEVKRKLLLKGKRQTWLNEQVALDTGLYVDHGRMWRVLTGQSRSEKIERSIRKILELSEQI